MSALCAAPPGHRPCWRYEHSVPGGSRSMSARSCSGPGDVRSMMDKATKGAPGEENGVPRLQSEELLVPASDEDADEEAPPGLLLAPLPVEDALADEGENDAEPEHEVESETEEEGELLEYTRILGEVRLEGEATTLNRKKGKRKCMQG